MTNMDRLHDAVASRGPVCPGLDTAVEYLPPSVRSSAEDAAGAVLTYNLALVDALADVAACFKVQIAYYEALGIRGLETYAETLRYIRSKGALVIADIKRGDIADTASRYAAAHLDGEFEADFVTLAPYMGMDTLEPWLSYVESKGKGAFVLMRTSNPGMRDFEYRELASGGRLYDAVGDKLEELTARYRGERGFGAVGAVVGCTEGEEATAIRKRYSDLFFLIPGYGAQGGAASDAARLLRNGNGGVVNASRSLLKAWSAGGPAGGPAGGTAGGAAGGQSGGRADNRADNRADISLKEAADAARREAEGMRDAILAACGVGARGVGARKGGA